MHKWQNMHIIMKLISEIIADFIFYLAPVIAIEIRTYQARKIVPVLTLIFNFFFTRIYTIGVNYVEIPL